MSSLWSCKNCGLPVEQADITKFVHVPAPGYEAGHAMCSNAWRARGEEIPDGISYRHYAEPKELLGVEIYEDE